MTDTVAGADSRRTAGAMNKFIRAAAGCGPAAPDTAQDAQPKKLPGANAGNGAGQTGPAVVTTAQLMNSVLRGVRR